MLNRRSIWRGLKIPRRGVDEWNPVAAELEAAREIGGIEESISQGHESIYVAKRCLAQLSVVAGRVHHENRSKSNVSETGR